MRHFAFPRDFVFESMFRIRRRKFRQSGTFRFADATFGRPIGKYGSEKFRPTNRRFSGALFGAFRRGGSGRFGAKGDELSNFAENATSVGESPIFCFAIVEIRNYAQILL